MGYLGITLFTYILLLIKYLFIVAGILGLTITVIATFSERADNWITKKLNYILGKGKDD